MTRTPVPTATLLEALRDKTVVGELPPTVTGIAYDSRKVMPGNLFVAVPGLREDGRRFVGDAVGRGATAVVLEGAAAVPAGAIPRIVVPSSREALARLADAYFGHPSRALTVVGITGTNGKTTTSLLVDALFRAGRRVTGVIGTIEYRIGAEARPAGQTTPEALELQSILAEMADHGVSAVTMEVSSHALAFHRADGVEFDVAVFTNLTQDHLDFHQSFEAYRAAKARLFALLASGGKRRRTAVINADDPAGRSMVAGLQIPVITFGLGADADVRPARFVSGIDGIRMEVHTPRGSTAIASPLVGEHNVMNLLGAVGVGLALEMDLAAIGHALGGVSAVPGRFERVEAGQPFLVVVDYAHTPDALERVLTTARKLVIGGRLGVVFGCGGDRDRGKRPLMGGIAARLADRVWVTSDNPRSERPEAIIAEIVAGIPAAGPGAIRHVTIPDRKTAIRSALGWAVGGDVVVIAGKGHETYQIVGPDVLPFDDREVARAALARRHA
ncbi:MAG TPA: UDP-N-acetylmuramoyl-L-alanyl-D-glutamate--2,6-diaminopimelate ligase [Methylomirabilota bacterium]|jgi:UDP-N-acetylmuramoyl-L-alanyl-D-glutamate--2,6-diaminopimelate ligase|nr:UDP-N-acetylmuramoyl-L-alanyl-D-glutamate--2,6-diaminopimelate ligase [Methylomirabilota bacterium]